MRKQNIVYFFFLIISNVFAQKPVIDFSSIENAKQWPSIGISKISNDGSYILYSIANQPLKSSTLIIQSLKYNWKKEFIDASGASFTNDNKKVIFKAGKDSLCLLMLGANAIKCISKVSKWQLFVEGNRQYLAYLRETSQNEFVLKNLKNEKEISVTGVIGYLVSKNNETIMLQKRDQQDAPIVLTWMNVSTGEMTQIYSGISSREKYVFDNTGQNIAFTITETNKKVSIGYYKQGMKKAVLLNLDQLNKEWLVDGLVQFSVNGNILYFSVKKVSKPTVATIQKNLHIWSYKDEYLPGRTKDIPVHYAAIDLKSDKISLLNHADDDWLDFNPDKHRYQQYVLLIKRNTDDDNFYNKGHFPSVYLVNMQNGSRTVLTEESRISHYTISPGERFVTWFDPDSLSWLSYEIKTHIKVNLSKKINSILYDQDEANLGENNRNSAFGIAAWEDNDDALFIYDQYDIWKVDPKGIIPSINLTNGYGQRNKIVFGFSKASLSNISDIIKIDKGFLLTGFGRKTKENGFWRLYNSKLPSDPQKEIMGPYLFYTANRTGLVTHGEIPMGFMPIKAKMKDRYLVTRQSASEYPNLFVTDDFKTFKQLTNLQPQKKYNWMTSEATTWQMPDGKWSDGILYKPENFDPQKRYPVIFHYYWKFSDATHKFIYPDHTNSNIDIPTYVSNGYLIFEPDIYYPPSGHSGQGIVNSVVSAAKYLTKFPWVDSTKLGIQGHSWGGYETNYLITHTNLFAAACEAAGMGDMISYYGSTRDDEGAMSIYNQSYTELGYGGSAYGIGVTPWTNPILYNEESPVMSIGSVTTPLLLIHGKTDIAVHYQQGVEMFLDLKRAGKKAWMLLYENDGHILSGDNAKDYTIRLKQFFDHYLKGVPPPKWMIDDIAERNDNDLSLDESGKKP